MNINNLFFLFHKRWSSPYLNRFIQPDTIVPQPSNPQAFNRYSYVYGNPIKYRDPSGHSEDCGIGMGCVSQYVTPLGSSNSGGTSSSGGNGIVSVLPPGSACTVNSCTVVNSNSSSQNQNTDVDLILQNGLGTNSCMNNTCTIGSKPGFWNDPEALDNFAMTTQDMATMASSLGAAVTITSTISGCIVGSPAGVLPGCAAGYQAGIMFHTAVTNPFETVLTWASFGATIWSDFLTNDNSFNHSLDFRNWEIGEDTRTGVATMLPGTLTANPFIDAGFDIYSSLYNHGIFCGISTILDCLR